MHSQSVIDAIESGDVVTFQADISTGTEPGKALLLELKEKAIPLLAAFGRGTGGMDKPIKTTAYLAGDVVDMINEASKRR